MDHEFSSSLMGKNQIGWDWMGLQLDDGTDLMLYRMRDPAGRTDYLSGTKVMADGRPQYLSDKQISIAGSDAWKSPSSGAAYPQRWTVQVDGTSPLVVQSEMPGQELITNASTHVTYFEGASAVLDATGRTVGRGYLEMTGYAAKPE
jgi:predicted secreted hydrolase